MNADAYNLIVDAVAPVLTGRSYQPVDTESGSYFTDGKAAIRVSYDEGRQMFLLEQAAMAGEAPEDAWNTLSSWLFAADAPVKDAQSIANDFVDSVREYIGVKPTVNRNTAAALPAKGNAGDDPTPAALAGRFLTVFPQFKGDYDRYVTENGAFLYVRFFEEVAVPHVASLLDADDKKRLVKLFDMLNVVYCNGTKEARAVVSAVILAGALRDHPERMETARRYMESLPHLRNAAEYAVKIKPKKA